MSEPITYEEAARIKSILEHKAGEWIAANKFEQMWQELHSYRSGTKRKIKQEE